MTSTNKMLVIIVTALLVQQSESGQSLSNIGFGDESLTCNSGVSEDNSGSIVWVNLDPLTVCRGKSGVPPWRHVELVINNELSSFTNTNESNEDVNKTTKGTKEFQRAKNNQGPPGPQELSKGEVQPAITTQGPPGPLELSKGEFQLTINNEGPPGPQELSKGKFYRAINNQGPPGPQELSKGEVQRAVTTQGPPGPQELSKDESNNSPGPEVDPNNPGPPGPQGPSKYESKNAPEPKEDTDNPRPPPPESQGRIKGEFQRAPWTPWNTLSEGPPGPTEKVRLARD